MLRCRESGDRAEWATDTWEAVAAQVAAALRTSVAMGSSYLRYAMAMRKPMPKVGRPSRRRYRLPGIPDDRVSHRPHHRRRVLAKVDAQLAALLARVLR
ncbi:hypothetical protein I551_9018 [Mycobacterium ulcerans str. Harvey]|uniref:DUF222 domain-containing protein n=1 Tax=Mycobacterium ulcerans str. Harvey TaxID=1299332 RepID=A0ABN0R963_MYCUL|nr:hypothetical protein I551_9018 [Mycobacterium ulcerans str. Harvey]